MIVKTSTALSSGSNDFVVVHLPRRDASLAATIAAALLTLATGSFNLFLYLSGEDSVSQVLPLAFLAFTVWSAVKLFQTSDVRHEGDALVFVTDGRRKRVVSIEDIDHIGVDVTEKTAQGQHGRFKVTVRQMQVHTVEGDVFDVLRPFKSEREEQDVVAKVNAHLDAFRRR